MSADVEGLITLGGLHMVHERNEAKTCGPIMAQGGIQAMETMLYTIDHINKQQWWIKDVPLGKLKLNSHKFSSFPSGAGFDASGAGKLNQKLNAKFMSFLHTCAHKL